MDTDQVVKKALRFATDAHEGQVRKYTGEPYINHPVAVAALVAEVTDNQKIIAAALLHDTVEDTYVTNRDIFNEFGTYIATWVENLTDVSKPEDGIRAKRKAIDLRHTAKALPPAQTIKLADLIDNTRTIVQYDADFARIYMEEKWALLEVLKYGNMDLRIRATNLVRNYFKEHKE